MTQKKVRGVLNYYTGELTCKLISFLAKKYFLSTSLWTLIFRNPPFFVKKWGYVWIKEYGVSSTPKIVSIWFYASVLQRITCWCNEIKNTFIKMRYSFTKQNYVSISTQHFWKKCYTLIPKCKGSIKSSWFPRKWVWIIHWKIYWKTKIQWKFASTTFMQ